MTLTSTTNHPVASVTTLTGRDYFRVSHDSSGRQRSVSEQETDNRSCWAGELAFNGEAYAEDEAVSASRFSGKSRGDFARLMVDLRTGRFGADVLVLWESSRGSRRVSEWCGLIDAAEEAGVRIAVTTHHRIYDPSNARDRRTLQEDAVDSEYESGKISARVLRSMTANAESGRPHAICPYGYRRRYDERTRHLLAQEPAEEKVIGPPPAVATLLAAFGWQPQPVWSQAELVRELFDRLRRGHSLKSIARDWENRGIVNGKGKPFSAQHLRAMALNPAYGGYRSHHGQLTSASWPALVPATTFIAVQRLFADRKGTSPRSGRARHLLSGIAVCDVCGGPLAAEPRHGKPGYRCRLRRCVTVDKAALDDLAEKVIVAYLRRRRHAEALTTDDGVDAALDAARAEVAKIKVELDQLYDAAEAGDVSPTIASRSEAGILKRLGDAEANAAELSTPSRLRGLIDPGEDVAERWKDKPLSAQREIARLVCVPELLGELRVARATIPGEIQDRVTWRREA